MQYVVLQNLESTFMNSFGKLKIKFWVQKMIDI